MGVSDLVRGAYKSARVRGTGRPEELGSLARDISACLKTHLMCAAQSVSKLCFHYGLLTSCSCNIAMQTRNIVTYGFQNQSLDVVNHNRIQGWVEQPDFRGSFDIITTCTTTVFICTYSMLVLNLPAPKEPPIRHIGRRILWMCIGIFGPEFPLTFAAGQWSRAKQSTKDFVEAGHKSWTMRHAFFADMGGFVLKPQEGPAFPINGRQLLWLVTKKKIELPPITMEELWDKSKQDKIVKIITAIQVTYFVLQCIGRAAQNLAITTLELNTLAIVICSLMTSYAWLHKGADVFIPFTLQCSLTAEELSDGNKWDLTPLDFIDDHTPGYSINVQPFMRMPVIPATRPIQRIPDDRFPTNPYGAQEYLLCFATMVFTGIHLAAWNMSFPTRIEKVLWRTSSLTLFGITVAFWVVETVASWGRLGRWKKLYLWFTVQKKKLRQHDAEMAAKRRQTDEERQSAGNTGREFPRKWEFCSVTALAIIYGVGRLYLIVEAFLEFRNMPASAFLTVDWAQYFPHT